MSSSENRSSSAVRNLRSLFENKHGDPSSTAASPETRGRSPSSGLAAVHSDREPSGLRRSSKVRASFVSVEPAATNMAKLQPSESTTGRRGSFGEADGDFDLKEALSQEPAVGPETAVSSLGATPMEEKEAENPDKPVTGAEEEPREMRPADLADGEAVSGGLALPPVAEDLRKSTTGKKDEVEGGAGKKALANGTSKPTAISTKAPAKPASSNLKSPASVKTPTSSSSSAKPATKESPKAQSVKAPLRKASRSSLTAPTAASMARSGGGDKPSGTATSKAKSREPTKPASLPSHLTAPTASSRAKHDAEAQSKLSTSNLRASTTSKPKPSTAIAKPTRSSLAPEHRPGSRTSQTSHARRSAAPADGSFLERMMKPTAASASKTHEKTEVKSPPRQKTSASAKPKTNGTTARSVGKKEASRTSVGSSIAAPVSSEVPIEEPQEESAASVVDEPSTEPPKTETATESTMATQPPAAGFEAGAADTAEVATSQQPMVASEPKAEQPAISSEVSTAAEGVRETITEHHTDVASATGNETPQAAGETATSGLEATPADMGSEETIR